MTDDIVTRLRKAVAQTAEADTLPSWDFATVVWEAADEIERLRAEIYGIDRLRKQKHNSLVLGPHDTLIIHVPMDTPKDVCEDLAQNVPDHLKGRIVVRSVEIQAVRFGAE